MKTGKLFVSILLFATAIFFATVSQATGEEILSSMLTLNDREPRLAEFKDDRETLRLKLQDLDKINKARSLFHAPPVELDIFASRVANSHCKEMAERGYLSHYNERGEKPYHRYAFAGGLDHLSENIFELNSSAPVSSSAQSLTELMEMAGNIFINEPPGADGHKRNIIDPSHTHVGIGIAISGGEFRYAQEFIDRYIAFDGFDPNLRGERKVVISGRVVPEDTGLYAVLVYGESLRKMTIEKLRATEGYSDYSGEPVISLWPWDLSFDRTKRTFSVPLDLRGARPGYYYVQMKLKKEISSIPCEGGDADTHGTFDASGIVLGIGISLPRNDSPEMSANEDKSDASKSATGNNPPSPQSQAKIQPGALPQKETPLPPQVAQNQQNRARDRSPLIPLLSAIMLLAAGLLIFMLLRRRSRQDKEICDGIKDEGSFRF